MVSSIFVFPVSNTVICERTVDIENQFININLTYNDIKTNRMLR